MFPTEDAQGSPHPRVWGPPGVWKQDSRMDGSFLLSLTRFPRLPTGMPGSWTEGPTSGVRGRAGRGVLTLGTSIWAVLHYTAV